METKHQFKLSILLLIQSIFAISINAQDIPSYFEEENTGANCDVTHGQMQLHRDLPNPFEFNDGSTVSTFEDWTCRRNEIKADIEYYEIGSKPAPPENITATYSGGTLRVTVSVGGRSITLSSDVNMPSGTGPFPVVIGMNSPTGGLSTNLFNGCIQIPFMHNQVVNYNMNSNQYQDDPFYTLYPELWGQIGNYSAWSWGISRLIDGLEIVQAQMNADLSKISVTGCSYAGKMALFGGAFDERIALTVVQESGGGGINSWRLSQNFTTRTGVNVEKIDNTNYSWFKSSMRNLDPYSLPHDHHELIAMIAPRAVLMFGNPYQEWLGDESGYRSAMAASQVWDAMGVPERFGFDFANGHNHCQASTSQNQAATAYISQFLRDIPTNTDIRSAPQHPDFDLNYTADINWTTPEITFNPNAPHVSITSPTASIIMVSEIVDIIAYVTDNDNNITNVEFLIDDVLISEGATAPYSTTWTTEAEGTYSLTIRATDADGNEATARRSLTVRMPQSPYGGTPHAIPGTIELEEYDEGGQQLAYYDASAGSETDVTFRNDEDVDLEDCDDTNGGYNLGYFTVGEWVEYTVDVSATGTYDIEFRVACSGTGRTIDFEMPESDVNMTIDIPNTTGWQEWQSIILEDVTLQAGEQEIRITMSGTEDYVNLNNMTFTSTGIIDPPTEGIQLYAGWNIIGYPHSDTRALNIALESIWDNVEGVKNNELYYESSFPDQLNLLQEMEWAHGYFIRVSEDCVLEW